MTSEKLDLTKVKNYTFSSVKSTSKTAVYTVKIKPENGASENYMTIEVDFRAASKNVLVKILGYGTGLGG